ncbi:hypothetical protein P8881_19480 [Bacillus haynesii]|uniref:hypothetical protein n=1 Tax=Bacillus haynesii TaxID=1925021 RepID=UPI00227F517F|nr:hypothetical protein [Bacillus haynesii]MCY8737516.1 hypothetical protein [Bacillus haynesii]MEC0709708.1 hypothetical protein [Bacillus haynesii]MEC0736913.1 hypothetical protein [Bacillus haynesii]
MIGIIIYAQFFFVSAFFSYGLFNITLVKWPIRLKNIQIPIRDFPNAFRRAYEERIFKHSVIFSFYMFFALIAVLLATWLITFLYFNFMQGRDYHAIHDVIFGIRLIKTPYVLAVCFIPVSISAIDHFIFRIKGKMIAFVESEQ